MSKDRTFTIQGRQYAILKTQDSQPMIETIVVRKCFSTLLKDSAGDYYIRERDLSTGICKYHVLGECK